MIKFKNNNNNFIIEFDSKKIENCEIICNTLRRILLTKIRSYSFSSENTSIQENTSILNNDIIKHRLELFPIQSFSENNEENITSSLYLNIENNTQENIDVTSNDFIIKINNKLNNNIFKSLETPIILCHLRPTQKIQLSSELSSGIAEDHDKYSVCHSYFKESNNIFSLIIEPNGIYDGKYLFKKSIHIYLQDLNILKNTINEHPDSNTNTIKLIIKNNNYTLLYLYISIIQKLDNVKYAACTLPHLSENNIIINIILNKNNTIKDISNKTINNISTLFKSFIKNL